MARKGKLGQKGAKDEIARPIRFKKYEYLFLIVCEDQNTEPAYFGQFAQLLPDETIYIRRVGVGLDPKGVAERAVEEKEKLEADANKEVDYVWIVFDIDDADLNDARIKRFNEAFAKAKEYNFNVAWSNEVFELWLLLHLTNVDVKSALERQAIYKLIQDQVKLRPGYEGYIYKHGNIEILEILQKIGDENEAWRRAENLAVAQKGKLPINANPCTIVYVLVKELRDWIKYYSYDPDEE